MRRHPSRQLTGRVRQAVLEGYEVHARSSAITVSLSRTVKDARALAALIKAGAGDRLMVSHHWPVLGVSRTSDARASRRYNPDCWLYAMCKLLPRVLELGSVTQIDRLNIDNPRRFLGD